MLASKMSRRFVLFWRTFSQVYQKAVRRHLKCGTTTCSYFASVHLEGTKVLVDVIRGLGQRAYVGKVRPPRASRVLSLAVHA